MMVHVTIDAGGKVEKAIPCDSTNPYFAGHAVYAVEHYFRFKPATRDGKPVKVVADLKCHLRLNSADIDSCERAKRTYEYRTVSRTGGCWHPGLPAQAQPRRALECFAHEAQRPVRAHHAGREVVPTLSMCRRDYAQG
jgi:hypothetical protein